MNKYQLAEQLAELVKHEDPQVALDALRIALTEVMQEQYNNDLGLMGMEIQGEG